jgi:signal transduction histidine kinase
MFLFLNYYNLSLFLGGLVALLSGSVVFFNDKGKTENQAWLLLNISTAIWSFGYFLMIISNDAQSAYLFDVILHIGAIFIPAFYYIFILTLTNQFKEKKSSLILLGSLMVFNLVIVSTNLFVDKVIPKFVFNYAPNAGPLYIIFTVYFFAVVIYSSVILIQKIHSSLPSESLRLKYILFSSLAGFIGGSNVFFITFNINFPPYLIVLFSFYPLIIAYAMLRYKLFNIKAVSTEILIVSLWMILLFKALLSNDPNEQILNWILFAVLVVVGVLLIRSIYNEVRNREKIETLAADLKKANEHLTELDRQKSEFVSFATHQLRAPLTAMKGYASLILEGDMGELAKETREGVTRIFDATNTLVKIVDDYLNVSRIELGMMKYAFETMDLKQLIEDTVAEMKPNIDKSRLVFTFTAEENGRNYRITADRDKLKQVITNLIDNAIKYTPRGSITATLARDDESHKFIFTVKDTGIGISPEILPRLFQKWSRAVNGAKTNIRGTGLGLYVAKQIVEAHHGKLKVESAGEGKGTAFIVELEPFAKA